MNREYEVFQGLVIEDVDQRQSELEVRLRDETGVRHLVTYHFLSPDEPETHRMRLEQWQERSTVLTYVRRAGHGVLVDDEDAFQRALD